MDSPTRDNSIVMPDASGVLVVQALPPLFINNTGMIELEQSQIVEVGQLAAGSIGRTFGGISCPVGNINAPSSTLSIQQVVISQVGAAPDGSGDLTLGTLYATAAPPGPPTLVLQAATGNLLLNAGDSLATTPPSQAGQVTVAAGTASPGAERSSLQLLDTDPSGRGGDILVSSTGNIVLQAPVVATASSAFGTTASDTLLVNAAATFAADTSVAGVLAAHGDITLGDNGTQRLTVNAQTTFASTSGPVRVNAALAAASYLTVSGTTALANTTVGSNSSQTLTVNAASTFTAPLTAAAATTVTAGNSFRALGSVTLGTDASNTVTVNAPTTITPAAPLTVDGMLTANAAAAFNAATSFSSSAPITANALVTATSAVTVVGTLTASGNTILGASSSQVLIINAVPTFRSATSFTSTAPVTANAAVTVAAGNAFGALGNATIGSSSADSLLVNANATFVGSATFSQDFQLYSNSSSPGSSTVLSFQRQNGGAAVAPGFILGSILFSGYDGAVQGPTAQIRAVFTDAAGKLGGSLIFSTSSTGSTSTGSSQLVDRLTIDSNGLATLAGSLAMPNPTATLIVSGSTLLNTLSTTGNTAIGATSTNALAVNAATTFAAAVIANAPVSITAGNTLSALGSTVIGTTSSQTLVVNAATSFAGPVIANAPVTVSAGNAFTATGNVALGMNSSNTVSVGSPTIFSSLATLTANSNVVLGAGPSQTLTVKATFTLAAPLTASAGVTILNGNSFSALGNTVIGTSSADTLAVYATTSFNTGFQMYSNSATASSSSVLGFTRQNNGSADATGKWGGSLVFSTSTAGTSSTSSSTQLVDRLTIDSSGLASMSGSVAMPNPTATLTVSGGTLLNTLSTAGNTAIGTTSSQNLAVNAATTFLAAVIAGAPVSITAGNSLTALGNTVIGTDSSNTLTVTAVTTFGAAVIANAPVTVSAGNAFTASGNVALGTDSSNTVSISSPTTFSSSASLTANGNTVLGAGPTQTLTVRATATLVAPVTANAAVTIPNSNTLSALGNVVVGTSSTNTLAIYATTTFNTGFQMYSNSATSTSSSIMGFQRQNNGGAVTSGFILGSILFSGYDGSDATGKWGGSLIFSTSRAGTSSTSSSTQLVDRLTIDSSGLATVSGSIAMPNPTGTLAVSGGTLLNTLSTSGNTAIGSTSSQTLVVNAATTFAAAVIANAPVTVSAGNAFTASGNANIGSSNADSLMVNANATFAGSATFNQAFQLYSNSSSPGSGVVLGFLRQNIGAAVAAGFTLGSILFSGYDGAMQGPTAQIRSVFTDATGKLGGSLILSTSSTGSTSTGSSQLVDRLTIDSSGLATLAGSLAMPNPTGMLSVTGGTLLNTLSTTGNTAIGTTSSQTLAVNAATTFAAPVTANTGVTVSNGNLLSALGNVVVGTSGANTLAIYAATTFNAGFQMYSNSATASSSSVMGFQRQNNGGAVTSGFVLGSILFSGYDGSDATGKWGGSLIFSTSTAGTSSSSSSTQLVDRLTIDSSGLATVSGSVAMPSPTGTLTVSGGTLLNTLSTSGNTAIGTTSSQTLVVNAATTFAAAVIANAPVTVSAGNAFTASGNVNIGSSNANSLMVNANATFAGSATFNQAFQLYSNSSSPGSGVVLGFLRQNSGAAVAAGFTLGSILFSGYDGAMQGPTAQIRSVFTDATGKLGGSLIFSTSSTGSTSTGSSQLVDRLTIDSSGLATLAGSLALPNPTGTLTVTGGTLLNTLSTTGNTAIGTTSSQTLAVNAATTFVAAVTANTAVTVSNGNLLSALGNVVVGTSSANTLAVYATTTFSAGFQMYSNSATASSGAVMGFQRQNNGGAVTSGYVLGSILFSGFDGADATGKWGGSLIFSTSTAGTSSTSASTQLVDRLTIDSNGLATVSGSIAMPSPTGTLTVSGGTLLNTLSTSGNTAIGSTSSQTLAVNAATTFAAAVIANAPVSVSAGNAFTASGNANIGSSNANSLMVNANATFAGSATFNQAFQLYSNSISPGSGVVLGFLRQNSGAAVAAGFTLGSILFSGYDGAMQGPTAQIRSVFTDATGNWGGSLVFSTSTAGTSSSSPGTQLVDRLTIDSSGVARFARDLTLASTSSTLTASGNTVLGTTGAQTLTVNAASSFASTATFTASTALYASGNVRLGATSGQTLTVPAAASFSAPLTVASTLGVTGLATLSGGVAMTTPVTVNGVSLATVATTNNFQDLLNKPRVFRGSSSFSTAASGAPVSPTTTGTWYGSVLTVTGGTATAYPTSDGTAGGAALFTSILSVQATAYLPSPTSAQTVPFVAVTGVSSDRTTVSLSALTGTIVVVGGSSVQYVPASVMLMCTIVGTY
ncbi:hypothetical protein ABBQ38_010376 [Trebouxia sp. C0009 RCD-2024]